MRAGAPTTTRSGEPDPAALTQALAVLSDPAFYPHRPRIVRVVETTLSFVFLAGPLVYKLKKPARAAGVDFRSLDARSADCAAELRLNRRLAPDVYLRLADLVRGPTGALALDGPGELVERLVVMRRLPQARMLDRRLRQGPLDAGTAARLAERLAAFYRAAERPAIDAQALIGRLAGQIAESRAVMAHPKLDADRPPVAAALDALEDALARNADRLAARVAAGRIVEGHGDLRPEHVCLIEPIVVFDCLEFDRRLRILDPFEEIAYLGLECRLLGDAGLGPALVARLEAALGDVADQRLLALYTAARALLRARLCLAHLVEPCPRRKRVWRPRARAYLAIAEAALAL